MQGYLGTGIIFDPAQQLTNHKKCTLTGTDFNFAPKQRRNGSCTGKTDCMVNDWTAILFPLPPWVPLCFSLQLAHTEVIRLRSRKMCVYAVVQTVCVSLTVEIEMVGQMVFATNKSSSAVVQLRRCVLGNSSIYTWSTWATVYVRSFRPRVLTDQY